ncbi:MAG: DUF1598 domain-containing protein [Planctomycetaceae bacterium]|nr:DUF1598 domain-containing protein [Planctomycetaceae bacterium]
MVRFRNPALFRFAVMLFLALLLASPAPGQLGPDGLPPADDGGNDDGDGDDGGGDEQDGDNVIIGGRVPGAGVVIDPQGVLSVRRVDPTGRLDRRRRQQAAAALDPDLARPSDLRKVSLNRLEHSVSELLAAGQRPTDDMLYLAGLTEIQYVFYYPETGDIVIAGPAEGFMLDDMARPRGIVSGRASLQLEDLIVALRAYGPNSQPVRSVGVSIDPTKEGLTKMQEFLTQFGRRAVPADTRRIVDGLKSSLGHQVVSVRGVPATTHFANVLVEADYRMKLIGIGLEQPPVKIASYVRRASPSKVSRNALQRWFFIPDYESVRVSDDGLAIALEGDRVKLVGADELVRADGTRVKSRSGDRASQMFVQSFTARYPELAQKAPVYAQMRNLIDMLIAAAYIQEQDFYGQADWSMEVFGDESQMPVEIYTAAKEVDTAINAIWKGNTLMTPIGGGVHINARKAISSQQIQADTEGEVADQREKVALDQLKDGQWWWD